MALPYAWSVWSLRGGAVRAIRLTHINVFVSQNKNKKIKNNNRILCYYSNKEYKVRGANLQKGEGISYAMRMRHLSHWQRASMSGAYKSFAYKRIPINLITTTFQKKKKKLEVFHVNSIMLILMSMKLVVS